MKMPASTPVADKPRKDQKEDKMPHMVLRKQTQASTSTTTYLKQKTQQSPPSVNARELATVKKNVMKRNELPTGDITSNGGWREVKKGANPKPQSPSNPINDKNRYEALDEVDDRRQHGQQAVPATRSKSHLPPVVVKYEGPHRELEQLIKGLCSDKFTVKTTGENVKYNFSTEDDLVKVLGELQNKKIKYHTFPNSSEKKRKLVLRGLPINMLPEHIKEELEETGIIATSVSQLRHPATSAPMPLFLIIIKDNLENRKIEDLEELCHFKIKLEKLKQQRGPPQCFNCQGIGHVSRHCAKPPTCVKCAGEHRAAECTLQKGIDQPFCANCKKIGHVASYRGCEKHQIAMGREINKRIPPREIAQPTETATNEERPPKRSYAEVTAANIEEIIVKTMEKMLPKIIEQISAMILTKITEKVTNQYGQQ